MSTQFTRDYFIAKFEAIPDEQWCEGSLTDLQGRHCAFGFCDPVNGANSEEGAALSNLQPGQFAAINDGRDAHFQQPTPKARILAALRSLPQ